MRGLAGICPRTVFWVCARARCSGISMIRIFCALVCVAWRGCAEIIDVSARRGECERVRAAGCASDGAVGGWAVVRGPSDASVRSFGRTWFVFVNGFRHRI